MPLPKVTRSPYEQALIIQNELDYDINELEIVRCNISSLNSDQQTINDAEGGRTVHSRLKVPIATNELFVCNIPKQSALARLIKMMKLLMWDEACMSNKHVAKCVDRSLRDICSCYLPFGGKVVVFGGDFRQILPVVKHGSRAEVLSACLNRSQL